MNRDKFIEYIDNPEALDSRSLDDINGVLQEYPWFQTAHMLLVKTLSNLRDMRLNNQLRISSAHVGNRDILFELINRHRFSGGLASEPATPQAVEGIIPDPGSADEAGDEVQGTDAAVTGGSDLAFDKDPAQPDKDTGESLADRILREIELKKADSTKDEDTAEREVREQGEIISQPEDRDEKMGKGQADPGSHEESEAGDSPEVLIIDEGIEITEAGVTGSDKPESSAATAEAGESQDLLDFEKPLAERDNLKDTEGKKEEPEKKNLTPGADSHSEAHSFSEWLMMLETGSTAGAAENTDSTAGSEGRYDLIERFLDSRPRIEPRSPLDESEPPVDMSAGAPGKVKNFLPRPWQKYIFSKSTIKRQFMPTRN